MITRRQSSSIPMLAYFMCVACAAVNALAQDLVLADCANLPNGVTSDICIVNDGSTGVDRVVFDRAIRRLTTTTPNVTVPAPIGVSVLETTQSSPDGAKDLAYFSTAGLFIVENDQPSPVGFNVADVAPLPTGTLPSGNSTPVASPVSFLKIPSPPILASTRVELFAGRFIPGGGTEELLVVVASTNGTVTVVDPNSTPAWQISRPWGDLLDLDLSTLRDVDVADTNADGLPDVVLLFNDRFLILRSGTTPSATTTMLIGSTTGRVVTARDVDGGLPEIFVIGAVIDNELPVHMYRTTGGPYAYAQTTSINVGGLFWPSVTPRDAIDGGNEWGLVVALDGARELGAQRGTTNPPEDYMGAIVAISDADGSLSTHEISRFWGGASRLSLSDFGPAKPARFLDGDGEFVSSTASSFDDAPDLVVLGDGRRRQDEFTVGVNEFRVPIRTGVVTLFQHGASHVRDSPLFVPTSQWRLASPIDSDISLLDEPLNEMPDRTLRGFALGQLGLGPEKSLVTVDAANNEIIVLRVQPLPCAVFITAAVHGHQGQAAQLAPVFPFPNDDSVDDMTKGANEYLRRINDARRPGLPNAAQQPDECAARHVQIRGHWESQTGGYITGPLGNSIGSGSLLSLSRVTAAASQYVIANRILLDQYSYVGASLPLIVGAGGPGLQTMVIDAHGIMTEFSGVDPHFYRVSMIIGPFIPFAAPYFTNRLQLSALAFGFERAADLGFRGAHGPVVADLSTAFTDTSLLVRENVDFCDVPIFFDVTGHSRGAPTISEALNARNGLSVFPFSPVSRANMSIHTNYLDAIDNTHEWTGIDWPWIHGGAAIKDGFVRRRGNESIATFSANGFDSLGGLAYFIDVPAAVATGLYTAAGGKQPEAFWSTFRPATHAIGMPQGYVRDLTFASTFATDCDVNTTSCAQFEEIEAAGIIQEVHAPLYYWSESMTPLNDDPPHQFADPAQFSECDETDRTSQYCSAAISCTPSEVAMNAPGCSIATSCKRPVDFCYRTRSQLGPYFPGGSKGPRANFLPATDPSVVGWAPEGGPGLNGESRSFFLRDGLDEREFLPDSCGGAFTSNYHTSAADIPMPVGLDRESRELVPDWEFSTVTNVVIAAGDVDEMFKAGTTNGLPELTAFLDDFPDLTGQIALIDAVNWLDASWHQPACVFAQTCPGVKARATSPHTSASFLSSTTLAMIEPIDAAAIGALPEEDRGQAFLQAITDDENGMTDADHDDYVKYLTNLHAGFSAVTETFAEFPTTEAAAIEAELDIRSRRHDELLVRVDVEFSDPTGYLDVYLVGDNLAETRRVSATLSGLGRSQVTFIVDRGATIAPAGLPDTIALEGRSVSVFSASVRPHRIFETPTGRLYELVVLDGGLSYEAARAVAMRTKYFGLPGQLAEPSDEATVEAIVTALSPIVPAWVGAKKLPTDSIFVTDIGGAVPALAFENGIVPSHADRALFAFLAPEQTRLSGRTNGVELGDVAMAFVVEYDASVLTGNCLPEAGLGAHWPLTSADVPAPVADVAGSLELTVKVSGTAIRAVSPLVGVGGHAIGFYGEGYYHGAISTPLVGEMTDRSYTVSSWIKPSHNVSGTRTIFAVGTALASETAATNTVINLSRAGSELEIRWEQGEGIDEFVRTTDLGLQVGQTYHVAVSTMPSPTIGGRVDVAVFVSKPGEGRIYEEAWFDKLPNDGTTARLVRVGLGNQYLHPTSSGFQGTLDGVRIWQDALDSVDAWMLFEGESVGESCGY